MYETKQYPSTTQGKFSLFFIEDDYYSSLGDSIILARQLFDKYNSFGYDVNY